MLDVDIKNDERKKYVREELIMTKAEFEAVEEEYQQIKLEQERFCYRIRKSMSESFFGRFVCCCFAVQDRLNLDWEELSPMQKKYRIKNFWRKAKLVYHFVRMRKLAQLRSNKRRADGVDDDGDVDLD